MSRVSRGIPHSSEIRKHHAEFVGELKITTASFLDRANADSDLLSAFKLATAFYCVVQTFGKAGNSKLLDAAAGLARRSAVLMSIRQTSLVKVELRRLVECTVWFAYFVDHPVEYEEFERNPSRGWSDDRDRGPIETVACSQIGFFLRYAQERVGKGKPLEAAKAPERLRVEYGNLSRDVHGALGALNRNATFSQAHDPYDGAVAADLCGAVDRVLTDALLTIAMLRPEWIGKLPATERGWFDWLIGSENAKAVRGGSFGL